MPVDLQSVQRVKKWLDPGQVPPPGAEVVALHDQLAEAVFENDFGWTALEDDRVLAVLGPWVAADSADEADFASKTFGDDDANKQLDFVTWLTLRLEAWLQAERATAGAAYENPDFAVNGSVPGTEYYKVAAAGGYLYAAAADSADWRTWEQRVRENTAPAGDAVGTGAAALLKGFPYAGSVLPGTQYYRLQDDLPGEDKYLYSATETAPADEWKPYSHWQQQARTGQQPQDGQGQPLTEADLEQAPRQSVTGTPLEQEAPLYADNEAFAQDFPGLSKLADFAEARGGVPDPDSDEAVAFFEAWMIHNNWLEPAAKQTVEGTPLGAEASAIAADDAGSQEVEQELEENEGLRDDAALAVSAPVERQVNDIMNALDEDENVDFSLLAPGEFSKIVEEIAREAEQELLG